VLHDTGVSVCSRVHFGRRQAGEREQYVRLAYSGIDTPQIVEGLERLKAYLSGDQGRAARNASGSEGSVDR
jgi:aspartate/methionine/tyrosine aminotransferase